MPNSTQRWYRLSLRELILCTLVAGLALTLLLKTYEAPFVQSGFFAKLKSGVLFSKALDVEAKGATVTFQGGSASNSATTRTAGGTFLVAGAPDKSTAPRLIKDIERWLRQDLSENGCTISGHGLSWRSLDLHYWFHGGSGIVYILITPSDNERYDLMVHFKIIEFASR